MKLSRRTEYACLALIHLSKNEDGEPVKAADIVNKYKIPKKYLEQILLQLKGAGIVKSIRGSAGGYKLARSPSQITIAEVIRLIDGPLAPVGSVSSFFYKKTPLEQNEKLLKLFKDVRDYTANLLENTTFEDII